METIIFKFTSEGTGECIYYELQKSNSIFITCPYLEMLMRRQNDNEVTDIWVTDLMFDGLNYFMYTLSKEMNQIPTEMPLELYNRKYHRTEYNYSISSLLWLADYFLLSELDFIKYFMNRMVHDPTGNLFAFYNSMVLAKTYVIALIAYINAYPICTIHKHLESLQTQREDYYFFKQDMKYLLKKLRKYPHTIETSFNTLHCIDCIILKEQFQMIKWPKTLICDKDECKARNNVNIAKFLNEYCGIVL